MTAGRKQIPLLLAALLAVAFAAGLYGLLALRFAGGDLYPAYSTLRADPLGSKAFHGALEKLPGFSVSRHLQALGKLKGKEPRTLFLIGLDASFLDFADPADFKELERLAEGGGRVVLAFAPEGYRKEGPCDEPAEPVEPVESDQSDQSDQSEEPDEKPSPAGRWGLTPAYLTQKGGPLEGPPGAVVEAPFALTGPLSVHTALYFEAPAPPWRVVHLAGGRPVLIERPFGKGSLVLLADAFPLSNEALRQERHPGLLAWLVGENRRVVFGEAHLGVTSSPGLMGLVRQYRLHGLLAVLGLLALLVAWKNAVPLVPPAPEPDPAAEAAALGKDHFTGLVNLLRRNIPARELPEVAFREWRRSFGRELEREGNRERAERVEELLAEAAKRPARERDPEAEFRQIVNILAERKLR